MKTITRTKRPGFFTTFTFNFRLILLIGMYFFATPSPAIAQSKPPNKKKLKESNGATQPQIQKIKPLGPADEFNRGVPTSIQTTIPSDEMVKIDIEILASVPISEGRPTLELPMTHHRKK